MTPGRTGRVFVFAGGGTGGHLFPGLAIAERLAALAPDSRSLFLCSDRPLDAQILRDEGADFETVPAKPFTMRPRGLIQFLRSWGPAVRAARGTIRRAASQAGGRPTVVATGGFVAAPAVQAAKAEGCPVVLVNLDAVPGKANRWIAGRADRAFTSARVGGVDWTEVPPIVRAAAVAPGSQKECRERLGLDPDRRTLLVTGASQGARSINRLMIGLVRTQPDAFGAGGGGGGNGWQVIHQTGHSDSEDVRSVYNSAQIPALVEPFFRYMGAAWGAADCALSRAGAGSVGEAWCNSVPTVFLPYPYHRDAHQRRNVEPLLHPNGAESGGERGTEGAIVVDDLIEESANLPHAGRAVIGLLRDPARREAMRQALRGLGPADGADRVAEALLDKTQG